MMRLLKGIWRLLSGISRVISVLIPLVLVVVFVVALTAGLSESSALSHCLSELRC